MAAQRKAPMCRRPQSIPGGHLNEVDALLAPRWSGYGGAPAVSSGTFVRQPLTRSRHCTPRRVAMQQQQFAMLLGTESITKIRGAADASRSLSIVTQSSTSLSRRGHSNSRCVAKGWKLVHPSADVAVAYLPVLWSAGSTPSRGVPPLWEARIGSRPRVGARCRGRHGSSCRVGPGNFTPSPLTDPDVNSRIIRLVPPREGCRLPLNLGLLPV